MSTAKTITRWTVIIVYSGNIGLTGIGTTRRLKSSEKSEPT